MASPKYQVKFKYHANIILNEEGEPADAAYANLFCKEFLRRYRSDKFPVYYPPDDQPIGSSYFDSLFHGLDNSTYTVIILTPGFVSDDGWNKYCQNVAQFSLMGSEVHRFIPIALGIEKHQIPKEISRSNIKVLRFPDTNWQQYELGWNQINKHLFGMKTTEKSGVETRFQPPTWSLLSDVLLTKLADQLGFGWETLALNLGVDMARIEQCQMSYPNNVHMQIFKTLWTWRNYHKGEEQEKLETLLKSLAAIQRNDLSDMIIELRGQERARQELLNQSLNQNVNHDPVQEDEAPAIPQVGHDRDPSSPTGDVPDSQEPLPPGDIPTNTTPERTKPVAVVNPQDNLNNQKSSITGNQSQTKDEPERAMESESPAAENNTQNAQNSGPGESQPTVNTTKDDENEVSTERVEDPDEDKTPVKQLLGDSKGKPEVSKNPASVLEEVLQVKQPQEQEEVNSEASKPQDYQKGSGDAPQRVELESKKKKVPTATLR